MLEGSRWSDQDNRAADVDNGHVQIAGATVHIPADPKSTSGQTAGTPAHLDTLDTDVDTQAAGSVNDVDTTNPANVQIAAGTVSTSPGTGPRRPDQDNRAADVDSGHVQIAGANVHIPAAPKSTSGQTAGTPAHLDTAGADVDTQPAGSGNDVDTTHPANVQIAAGTVSTSPGTGPRRPDQDNRAADVDNGHVQIAGANVHIPADRKSTSGQTAGTPAQTSKSAPKLRKKPAAPEPAPADAAAALLGSIEQLVESATSLPAHRSADVSAAKAAAKGLTALIPGGRRTVLGAAMSSSAAVLFYLIYHLTGSSNWALVAMSAGVIAGPVAWSWVTKRPAPAGAASDQPIRSDTPAKSPGRFRAFCFRNRFVLVAGALTLLAVGIGIALYVQLTSRPPQAAVSAWLVQKVAPLPVQVTALSVTYGPVDKVGCVLTYRARLQTTKPLYQRIDTAKYLTERFANMLPAAYPRPGTKDKLPTLPTKTLEELGPVPTPALSDLLLVEVKTVPGTTTTLSGSVQTWRENGRWEFENAPVTVNRTEIAGEPKPANAIAVESPADSDRLNALVAEHAAYAAKVQAAAATLAVQLERERQQNREALARLLQRGTWFTGVYVDLPKPDSHRMLLEVTDCSATTHEIILLARNDGGWFNTRPFRGTWSMADDAESCTAILRTDSFEGIRGAGFLIEEAHATALTLKIRLDGSVSCEPRNWDLQRVADADVAATKAEFGFGRVVAAAAPTPGGPVDQKLGGSAADQPIHRTSDTPPAAATPPTVRGASRPDNPGASSSGASALADVAFGSVQRIGGSGNDVAAAAPLPPPSDFSVPAFQLFSVSTPSGAYVYSDGVWLPLPRKNPRVLQSAPQKLTNIVKSVGRWQDALVGKTTEPSNTPIAELTFDGRAYVTSVSGRSVVIAYVGPLTPIDDGVKARYPELKTYPAIELAPTATLANGTRHAPLYSIAPGFFGFGPTRIDATLEWADLPVIKGASHVPALILRCSAPLALGKYALVCGPNSYELAIE